MKNNELIYKRAPIDATHYMLNGMTVRYYRNITNSSFESCQLLNWDSNETSNWQRYGYKPNMSAIVKME